MKNLDSDNGHHYLANTILKTNYTVTIVLVIENEREHSYA